MRGGGGGMMGRGRDEGRRGRDEGREVEPKIICVVTQR